MSFKLEIRDGAFSDAKYDGIGGGRDADAWDAVTEFKDRVQNLCLGDALRYWKVFPEHVPSGTYWVRQDPLTVLNPMGDLPEFPEEGSSWEAYEAECAVWGGTDVVDELRIFRYEQFDHFDPKVPFTILGTWEEESSWGARGLMGVNKGSDELVVLFC